MIRQEIIRILKHTPNRMYGDLSLEADETGKFLKQAEIKSGMGPEEILSKAEKLIMGDKYNLELIQAIELVGLINWMERE